MLSQKTIIIGPTAAIISTLVCYITVLSVYRLFLHPLAKFPGLKLAALTKWYEFYFDLINPFELHVQDPDWFDTLYAGNPTRRDKYPPAASMAGAPLGTFGTVEHDIHRKRRAANSHLLSTRAISDAHPLILDQVRILSDQFERYLSTKEIIDLRVTFLAFTTDTITRYALGENKNLQENKTLAVDWSATIRAVARITPPMKQFPWMMAVALYISIKIIRFFMPELSRLVHYHAEMRAFAERFLSQQQASQEKQKILETSFNMALFQCISDSNLPAHEKSAKRLAHEAVVVISAAAETTSRALSIAMFYILSGRQILRRLRDEIDIAMPDYSISPSAKALEGLPYLVATVKEALRISAIITSRMPLMAHTELAYKNWKIPPMAGPAFFPFVIE
ncbi:hypothetical protein BCIN_13g05840 [Botrytis cinerea B05.10]|uniref:Cytochrome p450 protein n=1 Tax=Botryotinia fuckeliana (strain B05.10) TaxID=332648 RepID=A0A384K1V7_BOTFB|nr:hypothetical protein BCIN_13g05840 [Botrytis cinerea B05.10]ATZ56752.1 hypothetical protein BCIN_13g05840 [Botrytis cinerea B05.10]